MIARGLWTPQQTPGKQPGRAPPAHILLAAVKQILFPALLRLERQHARRLARVLAAAHTGCGGANPR